MGAQKIFGEGGREGKKGRVEREREMGGRRKEGLAILRAHELPTTPPLLPPKRWFRSEIRSQVSNLVAQNCFY